MARRIAIIQGHPDPNERHFGHALAAAYCQGAEAGNHEVRVIDVAALDVPVLRSKGVWEQGRLSEPLRQAQSTMGWAEHWVFFYPLWLGTMPALLKAFLEQVLRPGFAIAKSGGGVAWKKQLSGRSARVVVTMGMPAPIYRWYFRAHSLKSFERNILRFCGIGPVRETLIGMVEASGDAKHQRWLRKLHDLGRTGR